MSKNHRTNEASVVEERIEATCVTDDAVETTTTVIKTVEEEPEVVVPETVTGIVSDCNRLNVRVAPVANSTVVCAIDKGSEVSITEGESTDEFYKVCTVSGFEGFCMKKYIKIATKQ